MKVDLTENVPEQAYWLLKSEPHTWSFQQQALKGTEPWDGVRNYQARSYLKQMQIGDLCFFYHSVKEKKIIGIVKVVSDYRLDPSDDSCQFGLRDMEFVRFLTYPVSLSQIKKIPALQNMILLKQSRLSVQPVSREEWNTILSLSEQNDGGHNRD